ncbi:MAG: phage tail tube protein, partial [Opitutae bacterium]
MALLGRKKILLAKIEATYNANVAPTGADAILVRNLEVTPFESDSVSRDLVRPYYGSSDVLLSRKRVRCTFSVEMAGSGTAGTAPRYGPLLQACAMEATVVANTSVTYDPVSSFNGNDSVTLIYNVDGVQHKVTGARGTFSLNAQNNEIPTIDFEMTGIYVDPTDTAQSTYTISYGDQAQPVLFQDGNTSSFSFHGFGGKLSSFSMAVSNEVNFR